MDNRSMTMSIFFVLLLTSVSFVVAHPQINFRQEDGGVSVSVKSEQGQALFGKISTGTKTAHGLFGSKWGLKPVPGIGAGGFYNNIARPCYCLPPSQCGTWSSASAQASSGSSSASASSSSNSAPGPIATERTTDGAGGLGKRIVNQPPPPADGVCPAGYMYCCYTPEPTVPPPRTCGLQSNIPVPGYNSVPGQAEFGEYPWLAVILSESNDYKGGGALLSSLYVLTAAHKIANYQWSTWKVRLGEWNTLADNEPFKYVERDIEGVWVHPGFNSQNLQNDVAVIKLKAPVELEKYPHINSICLPPQGKDFTGETCWVAGFGKDAFLGGKNPYILKEVDVPIVAGNECENSLRSSRALGSFFSLDRNSFICAGGQEGKDACSGDGGSPIVCKSKDGRFEVVGLVAWGVGCAEKGIPSVYVNVPNYVDWILERMK